MKEQAATFTAKSTIIAPDREHRRKINFNMARYNAVVPQGKSQFTELMAAREQAKNIKWHAIENLDKHLLQFEEAITSRGAKVFWADTAEDALSEILQICEVKNCHTIVKSKSM